MFELYFHILQALLFILLTLNLRQVHEACEGVTWSQKYQHYRHPVTAAIASLVIYFLKVFGFHLKRQVKILILIECLNKS
jgi:hypothetical protein